MLRRIATAAALLVLLGAGCSDDPAGPGTAPEPVLLASQTYGRYQVHPGLHSTHAEYELLFGVFEAPRTTADPQYYLFEGYSYDPGDVGRRIVIRSDEDDPEFSTAAALLTDGVRNVLRFRTRRVDGGMNTLDSTDYSIAQEAGYETEDLTGSEIVEFRLHIDRLQITQSGGDTIEDVEWTLEFYGHR